MSQTRNTMIEMIPTSFQVIALSAPSTASAMSTTTNTVSRILIVLASRRWRSSVCSVRSCWMRALS